MSNNPVNFVDPTGHSGKFAHDIGSGDCKPGITCPNSPFGTESATFDPFGWGIGTVKVYQDNISESATRNRVDPEVLASVVFNENRIRWTPHEVKDGAGVVISLTMAGSHDVSLGVTQMSISTAAYLDINPSPAQTGKDFDRAKFQYLSTLTREQRLDYIEKLQDPAINIEYAARYLAYIQASGVTDSRLLLAAYNHNRWGQSSEYGDRLLGISYSIKWYGIQLR